MAVHPETGEKLVEGVNADKRGGKLRPRSYVDAAFEPALKSLDAYATTLEENLPGEEQQLESEADITRKGLQSERTRRVGQLDIQRGKAETQTESAISEARRQADELLTGVQSRFGGTTGTGAFVGEQIGRETLRSVAANRTALRQTLTEIDTAEADLERQVGDQIFALDTRLAESKKELRRQFKEQVAQINMKKGELEATKGMQKLAALQAVVQQQKALEMANTQFKQQLFLKLADSKQALENMRNATMEDYDVALSSYNVPSINELFRGDVNKNLKSYGLLS